MRVTVRVQPNASKDEIIGAETGASGQPYLKMRVRAVPEKGKANKAVEKLLANILGLPKSALQVVTGGKTRFKGVEIDVVGDDVLRIAAKLERLMDHERDKD